MSALPSEPWRSLDRSFVALVVEVIDVDAIADGVAAELRDHPALAVDAPTLHNVRLTAFAGLSEFVREAGHPEVVADRAIFRAHGQAQHDAGRSVEEMLLLYRLVGLGFWRRVSEVMRAAEVSADLYGEITGALFAYVSDLAASAAAGFVVAGNEAARGFQARRDRLVEVLLEDPQPDPAVLSAAARAAGWELPDAVAVAVTDAEPGTGLTLPPEVLVGRWGDHTALVLPDGPAGARPDRIAAGLGESRAGLGPVVPLTEVGVSLRSAVALFALAGRRGGPGGVLILAGNELDLMVLADEDLAAGLAAAVLAPLDVLPPSRREPLIETLAAWLARPDQPLAIARELHVHVQTVRYRIRQLRELVGDTIDDPAGRARLAVAVRAHQLLRAPR